MTSSLQNEEETVEGPDLSNVVQGTAESLLNKLEKTVAATSISNRLVPYGRPPSSNNKGMYLSCNVIFRGMA